MDAIISCLVPPPPAALLSDAAIARASFHFSSTTGTMSVSPDSSGSCSSHQYSSPLVPSSAYYAPPAPVPPPHAASYCDSVLLVADSPTHDHRNHALAPRKTNKRRRSRASKRAPTTYISTDPANFRLMVQQVTGVHVPGLDTTMMLQVQATAAALLGADDDASALRQHQLQPPCFPTLDSSWNVVMYDTNSAEI